MANRLRRRKAAKMFFYLVVEVIALLALAAFAALIIWLASAPIPSYGQDFSGPFGTPAKLLPAYTLDAAGSNQWSLAQDVIVQPDSAKVPTVPEPSTVALGALGLAAVAKWKRNFNK